MSIEFKEIEVKNSRVTQKPNYLVDVIFSKQKYQEDKKEFYKLYLVISKNLRYYDESKLSNNLSDLFYSISYKNKDKLVKLFSNDKKLINYQISTNKQKQFITINIPTNIFNNHQLELIFDAKFKANNLNEEFTNTILLNNKATHNKNKYLNNLITYYKNYDQYKKKAVLFNLLSYELNYKQPSFTINKKYLKIIDFDYKFNVNLHKDFNNNWEINYLINNLLNSRTNNFIQISKLQINDFIKPNKYYKDLPKAIILDDGIYFNNYSEIKDQTIISDSNTKGFIFNGLVDNTFYYDLKIFDNILNFKTKINSLKFIDCNDCNLINPNISKYLFSKEFFLNLEVHPNLESELNKYEVK
ncbi:hypothetical protein [Mycoplasma mycoides]|uniref:hypothetical protein n=1 Tax=Mycoplasma mycoides TaxID=2102 RepID=UPI002240CD11|nr:hypothetical protein [Mycoplasma mycoides]QVK08280.1 hypothetical protein I7644_02950 [Mycoplasma mycoides subsp. capri]